jgi:ribosomal protein S27E
LQIAASEKILDARKMLFSPTIGCALKARHWFLWVRCPACHTTQSIDLRTVDRHPFAALSCRSCRPHALFVELICLADKSVADVLHDAHTRRALGE